jgi:hypothetical protein
MYRHLLKHPTYGAIWLVSAANEFGRLAQGIAGRVAGTDTMFFIQKHQVPQGRKVTYPRVVCQIQPEKSETHRTRITAGGNLLDYLGNVSTETASLEMVKILLNSAPFQPQMHASCAWMQATSTLTHPLTFSNT